MKIAIIGAGSVGGTLGRILASKQHYTVTFAVRDPHSEKMRSLLASISGNATAEDIPTAVAAAEVVILATPWDATQDAINQAGDLSGKILIDCSNPVALGKEGLSKGLLLGHTTSGAEEIAKWAPGARIVKAFNNIGANNFEHPVFGDCPATAFICGDDDSAKAIVASLAQEIGFEVVDAGKLQVARLLEPLGMLWIQLAIQGMGREFAITLVSRETRLRGYPS